MVTASPKYLTQNYGYQTSSNILTPLRCKLLCDFKVLHIHHDLVMVKWKVSIIASFTSELTKPWEEVAATANQ